MTDTDKAGVTRASTVMLLSGHVCSNYTERSFITTGEGWYRAGLQVAPLPKASRWSRFTPSPTSKCQGSSAILISWRECSSSSWDGPSCMRWKRQRVNSSEGPPVCSCLDLQLRLPLWRHTCSWVGVAVCSSSPTPSSSVAAITAQHRGARPSAPRLTVRGTLLSEDSSLRASETAYHVWALGSFSGVPHCSTVNDWGPFEPVRKRVGLLSFILYRNPQAFYNSFFSNIKLKYTENKCSFRKLQRNEGCTCLMVLLSSHEGQIPLLTVHLWSPSHSAPGLVYLTIAFCFPALHFCTLPLSRST